MALSPEQIAAMDKVVERANQSDIAMFAQMDNIAFIIGSIMGTALFRFISMFIIKKMPTKRKMLYGYVIAAITLFFLPALGMTDGGQTPWSVGLAVYIPILLLFLLWDLKKSKIIDREVNEKNINWNRGIMRVWAVIFIPTFLIIEFQAYTTLMDAKYSRNTYSTYERSLSDSLTGYLILIISLGIIQAIKWIIRGFKSTRIAK